MYCVHTYTRIHLLYSCIRYRQTLIYNIYTLSSKFKIYQSTLSVWYHCYSIPVVLNREVPLYKTSYSNLKLSLMDRFCHMCTQSKNTQTHTHTHTHAHTHTHTYNLVHNYTLNSVLSMFSSGHVDRILFWCVGMVNMSQSLSYGGELYSPHHVMYNSIQ